MKSFIYKLFEQAKKDKDLKAMRALLNGNPSSITLKFEYAKLLIFYGFTKEGKEMLEELLDTPNERYAKFELAKLAYTSGNNKEAKIIFKDLADQGDRLAYLHYGRILLSEGKNNEARKIFSSLANMKNFPYGRLELAKLNALEGNISLAKDQLKSLIKTQNFTTAKIELGMLEANLGNNEQARVQFEDAANNDNSFVARIYLGRLELSLGNYELARNHFEKLNKISNDKNGIIELGRLEGMLGNYEAAEKHFCSLIGTRVEEIAYKLLIVTLIKGSRYAEAVKYIDEAIKKGYHINPDIIINVGLNENVFFDLRYKNMSYNYTINQLIDYDEFVAIDHIIERHASKDNQDFNEDIDVYELYNNIGEKLNEKTKIKKLIHNDIYVVPYENVGKKGENYLKIITLPNSQKIITMYPTFSSYELINEELNQFTDDFDDVKSRKLNKN